MYYLVCLSSLKWKRKFSRVSHTCKIKEQFHFVNITKNQ